jgi:hypothetical protein
MENAGGNGGLKPEQGCDTIQKTEAQLATERLARYTAEPESFTENTDLIVAIKRSPKGMQTLINNATRVELELSWARLNHGIMNAITSIEMQEYMKKQSEQKVLTPKHGMMDFARRRK